MEIHESEPTSHTSEILSFETLLTDAESLHLRMQNNHDMAQQLADNLERYLSEKLLSGDPVTEDERSLSRVTGCLCRMMGIEVPLFIELNYTSGQQR